VGNLRRALECDVFRGDKHQHHRRSRRPCTFAFAPVPARERRSKSTAERCGPRRFTPVLDKMPTSSKRVFGAGAWSATPESASLASVTRHRARFRISGRWMRTQAPSTTASATMTFRFVSTVDGWILVRSETRNSQGTPRRPCSFRLSAKDVFTTLETSRTPRARVALVARGYSAGEAKAVRKQFRAGCRPTPRRVSRSAIRHGDMFEKRKKKGKDSGIGSADGLLDGLGDRSLDDSRDRTGPLPADASTDFPSIDEALPKPRPVRAQFAPCDGGCSASGTRNFLFAAQTAAGCGRTSIP